MTASLVLVFSLFVISVWMMTLAFVIRQSRQMQALRSELDAYMDMRERIATDYQRVVNQLLDCSRGVNQTLHDHDRRLRAITTRNEQISTQDSGGQSRYREAVNLLRRGADEDELVGACGLSRGEAHLIAHLERLQNRVVS
jgi:hypothetical protein